MSKKSANIKHAIPTLSREAVISYLSRAGTGELVDVIFDALQQDPAKKPQNDGDCEVRVVLAQAFRSRDESANRPLPEVHVIGTANDPGWSRGNLPLCQSGTCRNCGAEVMSHVKRVICPVCGATVYLS